MSRSVIPISAVISLVLAAASWGVGTVVSKRAVAEIPPLELLVIQLATSVVVLVLVSLLAGSRPAAVGQGRWPSGDAGPETVRALDRLGLLNPGASYALSLIGLNQISASLSVLLWAVEPVLILGLAWWWLHEPITRRLATLSIAALGGMALVVWAPGAAGQTLGVLVTLVGVGCCAIYTVLVRQRIGGAASTLRLVLGQQSWALGLAVMLFLGSVALDLSGSLGGEMTRRTGGWGGEVVAQVSADAWLSAVVSGVAYYALAYGFYLTGLRRVQASVAASAFYLIPVFGVFGGWAILGERLDPGQLLGAAIVVGCVVGIAQSAASGSVIPAVPGAR
ncbi:MAG TPA: DMT family transporter [Candidatus Sulfomarinibacteraceae bacterium]|nr:DMT family transporter [Candidatus Sulfomarinibacteraceae bacterium]